jgi:bifunctional DNA-binding transcriptional regulator/antitoxin component of YhaV-PrlF toxin-antitoxin module
LPDDPIIAVTKVLPRGVVQLPPEVRERLSLKLGMKLIVATADDALVMKKVWHGAVLCLANMQGLHIAVERIMCKACTLFD